MRTCQIISVKAVLQRQWQVRILYKLCSGCFKLCQAPPLCIHVTFQCARVTVNDKKIVQNQNTKSTKQACLSTKVSFIMGNFKASTEMQALWWMHLLTISHIDLELELFLRLAQTLPRKSHHLFPSLFCLCFSVSAAAGCVLAVRGPEALFTLEPQGNSVMSLIVFMECRVSAASLELVSSFFIDFCLQTSNTILSSDMSAQ